MMIRNISINAGILIFVMCIGALSYGGELPAKLRCDLRLVGQSCNLGWDFSTAPRTHYVTQSLDKEKLDWVDVGPPRSNVNRGKVWVSETGLYRIVACDNLGVRRNCETSSAVWVSSLVEVIDMPLEMSIVDYDGTTITVHISDEADRYTQSAQYNVFLLTDLVNSVGLSNPEILPPMYPPDEPVGDQHPNLDHQVQHNTYNVYEELRVFHQSDNN